MYKFIFAIQPELMNPATMVCSLWSSEG